MVMDGEGTDGWGEEKREKKKRKIQWSSLKRGNKVMVEEDERPSGEQIKKRKGG